ncbi:hypothetical protein [Pedobacter borealis]|uniref:hypothetical protein n=1 Tax=Pedobacter borealis TaxID=475254 RepID=UPI0004934C72|nr:hypothetical protein [Pedobacter borealis]
MADIKKRILTLSSGRNIKLYGNSIAINKSLELSEGYAPNVLGLQIDGIGEKASIVLNPLKLTADEIQEIADYNIRLWMQLKDNIRQHGLTNSKIFYKDAVL